MYDITDIKEILIKVSTGKDTLDQQTAQDTLEYIHDLEVVADARGKEKIDLKDQLHRRNALIKKLRTNYNRVINSLSTEQLKQIFNIDKKEVLK